ncbi:hypothetical protein PCANC_26761 [Puccinia coronata f. sp. avenae]|uniref:SAM domain-containing protein n=1 Tax=Puccinia coronata f. sp. avenae TaxID=200324 RepID=A0A2N5TLT6_9BASI|nr:hypothetical protein PCANC_26761 [Puccinia coronata f. sp. avenae]
MNTPQQTPQQPQPPATKRATPPVLPAPREEVNVEETPSKASLDLGEVRASPFAIGDAIGVVNAAERGLQLMYCVSRPDLPGGGLNKFQHPHLHQYRVGNKLLGPPVDVLYDAVEMAYGWRSFKTFAINHFSTLNPGAANQIRANRRTPALTWQGIIPHHPWYDRRANAMIQGEASWRQFVVAIADAAQHGQNSQLWCVSHELVLEPDAVVAALARHPRGPSADIMILVPAVPVVHLGNSRTPLPDIMVMVPSPTVQRELSVQIIRRGPIFDNTKAPANRPAPPTQPAPDPNVLAPPPPGDLLTMDEFLTLLWIAQEDMDTRELIKQRKIHHWTYFTLSDEQQLRDLGFEEGPACLLCLGVARAQAHLA